MTSAAGTSATVSAADVERWLRDLDLEPPPRQEREGIVSWDLELDGRRRADVPITLILDPQVALICWVHFAPPIGDMVRRSYRKLLRWNDEFPFAKFSLAEDERPILASELPIRTLDRDELGLALARSLAVSDRLLEESAAWIWIGGRIPDVGDRPSRGVHLIDRYADRLGELLEPAESATHEAAMAGGANEGAAPVAAETGISEPAPR